MKMTTTKHNSSLRGDFPPHTTESWELAAKELLKGKPFEQILKTNTTEGIVLEPIYSNDSKLASQLSGEPPFTRRYKSLGSEKKPWLIFQEIKAATPADFNIRLKQNLNSGQNAIFLRIEQGSPFAQNIDQWRSAFKDIAIENIPLFIKADSPAPTVFTFIQQLFEESQFDIKKLQGGIFFDPLAQLLFKNSSNFNGEDYYPDFATFSKWVGDNAPQFGVISVDATVYHNAGANAVQELAFALAAAVESIRQILDCDKRLNFLSYFKNINFNLPIGANFFMEIAKLRALHILWHNISKAFGGHEGNSKIRIHAETSAWNKTILDEHTNILRATTEAFSAILGGCDSLQISPFNFLSNETDAFAEHIARNIQLILQDEVHAGKVLDAVGGSWYVESLTKSLAEKAWQLFQKVEKKGGMIAALQQGFIQKSISETRSQRMRDIETRRSKIKGKS